MTKVTHTSTLDKIESAISTSGATSTWLTVTFTIERYIAVCHPIKGKVSPCMVIVGRFIAVCHPIKGKVSPWSPSGGTLQSTTPSRERSFNSNRWAAYCNPNKRSFLCYLIKRSFLYHLIKIHILCHLIKRSFLCHSIKRKVTLVRESINYLVCQPIFSLCHLNTTASK